MKHFTRHAFALAALLFIAHSSHAQQGMGVGNNNPLEMLDVTGAIKIGTDINNSNAAPTGGAGTIRFRAGQFEGWDGTSWIPLGGGGGNSPFEVNSNVVQSNTSFVTYATDDFIFGSPSLDDDGDADHDGRFFYDKNKGAFRAGLVTGDQWDDIKRGNQSFAAGFDVTASGDYAITLGEKSWATAIGAIAMGRKAYAEGNRSLAWGNDAQATGEGSVALGRLAFSTADYSYAVGTDVNANGEYSVAFGYNADALNDYSVALGADVTAAADESVVLGYNSTTTGYRSVALGYGLTTVGDNSIAAGSDVTTLGSSSVAAGFNLSTFSAYEFVLGRYNTFYIPSSATSWQGTDRLLTVGNGTGSFSRSDALTILKNGNTGLGTSTPSATLHVDGSLRIVDGNQSDGYVLTSDGSGNATWQAAGSGNDNQNLTGATLTGTTLEIDIEDGSSASVNLSGLVDDADADATNELQTLSLSANTLSISAGNNVDLSGYVSTDDQNLTGATLTGTTLEIDIEGGNSASVSLASLIDDADADATNEIQTLNLSGNTLSISGSNDVDLSGYVSTDDQNLTGATLTGTTLEIDIEGGSSTSVSLASLVDDADADAGNELQTLSQSGTDVTLSNGGGTISVADNDNDASNEIQTLSISGNDISLSNGGGTVSVPIQTELADDDNDTKIQVEESADEDNIRFDISGTETHRIEKLTNTNVPVFRVLSNSIYVGNNISPDAPAGSNVAIGANSATALASSASENTFVGSGSGRFTTAATNNTYLGLRAGLNGNTASGNTTIGAYAGEDMVDGNNNVIVGLQAAYNKTGGGNNVLVGYGSGENNGTGSGNVFLGRLSGRNETGSNKLYIENTSSSTPLIYGEFDNDIVGVNGNLGVGTQTPLEALHVEGSVLVGPRIGVQNSGRSVFIGQDAGAADDLSNNDNTFVGYETGLSNTTGYNNTAVGTRAFLNGNRYDNAAFGNWTLYSNTTGVRNTALGSRAGQSILGNENTIVGSLAGKDATGSGNVFLGHMAGQSETGDNKLYIENTNSSAPLIYGEFDNDIVGINGNLGVGISAPDTKLHVSSASTGDASGIKLTQGSANSLIYHNSNNDLILRKAAQTDQLVLHNSGEIGIGTVNPISKLHVVDDFGSNSLYVATIQNTANSGWANGLKIQAGQNTQSVNNRFISFVKPNGTEIGAVRQVTSSSVDYNTTSDERLKTNIQPTTKGLNDLMQIEVKDYVYKEDLDKPQTGFIAQQVYAHYPNAVSPGGDDVKTDPWMMDYGKMSPLLVKAIQDQQEMIQALQVEVEALKAQLEQK